MISVMIVDDHQVVRMGARAFLQDEDITVVAEAEAGLKALKLIDKVKPQVVLLDFNLPDVSGFEIIRRLKRSQHVPKLLMLTAVDNLSLLNRMLQAGASGILTKNCKYACYPHAVRCAYEGDIYVAPDVAMRLVNYHAQQTIIDQLTDRELDVALLTIRRITVERIAERLNISPKSVSNIRVRILKQTGFKSFAALGKVLGKALGLSDQ